MPYASSRFLLEKCRHPLQFPLMDGAKSTPWVRISDTRTYAVASKGHGITEYDADGKVIWDYQIDGRVYGARRLKNGNVFICAGGGKRILEISQDKEIVWEVSKKVPDTTIEFGWMTCIQESVAGNYFIGNCHAGDKNPQIFETTKDKKVVWKIDNFELVSNGLLALASY